MQLLWSPRSPFVRKVMIVLHELGRERDVELVRSVASMAKVNPQILKHNPLGKISVLLTPDAGALYDSAVICEYLDALFGGQGLFPASSQARIVALRRQALGDGLMDVLLLSRNEVNRPDGVPSQTYLAGFERKIASALAALESEVASLNVDAFNIGHVTIGCALGYLDFRFAGRAWRDQCPELAQWFAQFELRPSAVATRPVDEAAA